MVKHTTLTLSGTPMLQGLLASIFQYPYELWRLLQASGI